MADLSFSDEIQASFGFSNMFDIPFDQQEKGSFGFMDLLGFQDFNNSSSSLFDLIHSPMIMPPALVSTVSESSPEVLNAPATPNSPSVSSSSNEGVNEEQVKGGEDEEEHDQAKTKKELKPKKKNQKREKQARFAFMTKSEVDHLDDGFRWRKYGQKAVKNSPYPRSYYRCTTAGCGVKKRVERSSNDPSIVVTTYEGKHTHSSPLMPRGNIGILPESATFGGGCGGGASSFTVPTYSSPLSLNTSYYPNFYHQERLLGNSPASSLIRDNGLLQDIVPSQMMKEMKNEY